jgi:hypothetical protein
MVYADGTRILPTFEDDTYYGEFVRFLRHPETWRTGFRQRLLLPEVRLSTRFRAKAITLSHRFGIRFDEAAAVADLADLDLDDAAAADLVLDNYLSLLAAEDAHPGYGAIDECGRLVLLEGTHRTAINLVRGRTHMPFRVLKRSAAWTEFIAFFHAEGARLYGDPNQIYQDVFHPDFASFRAIREDRSQPILDYLSRRGAGRRGLDVGSMIGFNSHKLGAGGFAMTALEYEAPYAAAFRRLAILYDSHAEVVEGDLYGFPVETGQFDFAILLSILYHLLRNDEARCVEWLERLKQAIPCFIVDTEARTGLLPESRLRHLFAGHDFARLHEGVDGRDVWAISRQ